MSEVVVDPVVPAAPAAPAVPAAPAAPAAPVQADQGNPTPATPAAEEYAPATGSRQLDVALKSFASQLNLSPQSAEIQELLKSGNVDYIRGVAAEQGKLDMLAPFFDLAASGKDELKAQGEAKEAELRTELEGYAGGKEGFAALTAFAKSNSTPEQIAEFDKAFYSGGLIAQAVIEMIGRKMGADPNVSVQGRTAVVPHASAQPGAGAKVYNSEREWMNDQQALIRKFGKTNYANTTEYAALVAAYPKRR